jgi:hypothetical protein
MDRIARGPAPHTARRPGSAAHGTRRVATRTTPHPGEGQQIHDKKSLR